MNRIADIAARLQRQTDASKMASGSLDPTRFEEDLVAAINGENSVSSYQSGRGMDVATRCVATMKKHFGGVKKAEIVSKRGANGESVLSPIYRRFMCADGRCSGEPKSDIIFSSQMHGKMQVSIKKEGSAQVASAQEGEIAAVLSAALGTDRRFVRVIRDIITQTLSKSNYYSIRNKYAQEVGASPEDFDSMLSRIAGLKTGARTPDRSEIAEFNQFLQTIGVREKITSALHDFMVSTGVRKSIFKEFASGENRYKPQESRRRADWFMVWNENGKIEIEEIDSFVNSHFGSFRMNIRDRGNQSGGSLRIDIREDFSILEKEILDEFDYYCLTEGVIDTTVSMIKTAGSAVATLYKTFVAAVKTLIVFIVALFSSGVSNALQFFGLETTDMSYSW